MKTIYKLTFLIIFTALAGSCSEDYLSTKPSSSSDSGTIFENADYVAFAVNGLYKCMTQQYSYFGQGYNGEGTIKYYYGEMAGNDFILSGSGNTAMMNHTYHTNDNSTFVLYAWYYYYRVIGNANYLIDHAEGAQGNPEVIQYYIAQAKVMRAYCYFMLSQLYHRRWSDGMTDEAKIGNGLVLRIQSTNDPMPLSSAEATYTQIYRDLNEAIPELEKETVKRDKDENYQINKDVAYAIYARVALTRNDYPTALEYATKAYKNYPLMSNVEYGNGFCDPTSEWIWSSYGGETETLFYYSYFAYLAYNANTSTVKSYPRCISKELFEKIPLTDVRRTFFLDPEGESYSQTNGQVKAGTPLYNKAFKMYPDIPGTAKISAFMQFKFKCKDNQGVGHMNHFRASEMYLIEAEAQYFLNNEKGAREALIALNRDSGRDPNYTCTATGEDLLNEIKFYRRVELWGEGFGFFDIKRYGDKISRKSFKNGGNFNSKYAVTLLPDDEEYNYFTCVLPLKEINYNPEIQ